MGVKPGERLALCLVDSVDFPVCFLGAILAGIVPVPVSSMWTAEDLAHMLADSGAAAGVVSAARLATFGEAARVAEWRGNILVSGETSSREHPPEAKHAGEILALAELLADASHPFETRMANPDDICFWLYSSGSTGKPKAAVHPHKSMALTAELFAKNVLGMNERDVVFSAAKLFFAYGLGNSLSFPMHAGATAILCAERPTPQSVIDILRERRPTIFFGVPTLFAALLECNNLPHASEHALRFCVSAGEALPEHLGKAWKTRTGVDIIDGIGSTEMLHIFISNAPGAVEYGTTGRPVAGYEVKLLDEAGNAVADGEIGDLWVSGPTRCAGYWNDPARTRTAFAGEWMRTGDRYRVTAKGDFVHCGRSDDMLKVGGIWVSPLEVEGALLRHEAVLEAAVVGHADEAGLIKPKAFAVLKNGYQGSSALEEELQRFVKSLLAPYKYPRWIEFVPELPRTATGKLQRFRLRQRE